MNLNLILGQAPAPEGNGSMLTSILMMVALFAIFYFFMIRPQKNRQKEVEAMRNALAVGDAVITSGGIHGKLKEIKDAIVVVEIANNVNITVDKNSIYKEGTAQEVTK